MEHCSIVELFEEEILYSVDDLSNNFYFLLSGEIDTLSFGDSVTVEGIIKEGRFFGLSNNTSQRRGELLSVKSSMVQLLQFDTAVFH